jgi:hypothetical protein
MSQEEIRWWLTELLQRRDWSEVVLRRTLAIRNYLPAKVSGQSFIWPTEQIRMSAMLDRIISGELVCRRGKRFKVRGEAVLADDPKPLRQPASWRWDMQRRRLLPVPPRPLTGPTLPTFKNLLENVGAR